MGWTDFKPNNPKVNEAKMLFPNFLISPKVPLNLPINLRCPARICNLFEMAQETYLDLPGHWEQILEIELHIDWYLK